VGDGPDRHVPGVADADGQEQADRGGEDVAAGVTAPEKQNAGRDDDEVAHRRKEDVIERVFEVEPGREPRAHHVAPDEAGIDDAETALAADQDTDHAPARRRHDRDEGGEEHTGKQNQAWREEDAGAEVAPLVVEKAGGDGHRHEQQANQGGRRLAA